jgi:uncharacterized integral membrane protein
MSEDFGTRSQRDSAKPGLWRLIFALIFLVAIALFAVENNHKVDIRFVGPTVHASLTIALLVSAVLGALMSLSIRRHTYHR